ncbi:MAG: ATP-binding protein [Armatimonadota bacterium]
MATFRTRARALDMLGRQQIAGIPTAISELFKNAHDAYATKVEVDFYRADYLFVLRDDGFGMTQDDFESRWLTLATESKVANKSGTLPPAVPDGFETRPIMGEKGIGRLSIGVIGPQVLVLTRAVRNGKPMPLVAAYINWKIFEIPGVNLDDIEIPLQTFPDDTFPDKDDIQNLLNRFSTNLTKLSSIAPKEIIADISEDIDSFNLDPLEIDAYLQHLSLKGDGHGTHFYIRPTYETLLGDLNESPANESLPPLVKVLIGFTNTMTPGHTKPRITTAFRDHPVIISTPDDVIAEQEFWTPDEFSQADHHFQGRFDENGQFRGAVTVYGKAPVEQIVPWLPAKGRPTDCGPFTINFAYIQGDPKETNLPPEIWARMSAKGNRIGGLYIYRDGIRILPYGNNDYDWLNIERNRSKKANYYFFSYRRMFGVVEISNKENFNLNEKAGREGFRENKAYRQFREILMNYLVQTAADFFRPGGIYSETYEEIKGELERAALARNRREGLVREKIKLLNNNLDDFFSKVDEDSPEKSVESILTEVTHRLTLASASSDPEQAAVVFLETEARARRLISNLKLEYRIAKPRGMGLSKELSRKWLQYQRESSRLEKSIFEPAIMRVDELVGDLARQSRLSIDRRRRIERTLQDLSLQATRTAREEGKQTDETVDEVKDKVIRLTRDTIREVRDTTTQVLSRFAGTDFSEMDELSLVDERSKLEEEITNVGEKSREVLESIREQLKAINLMPGSDGRLVGSVDETEDLEQRLLVLEEKQFEDLELMQLGSALQIVNHEFKSAIITIRRTLKRMKAWADVNQDLDSLYTTLRNAFDHLDGYLTLFTPLQRRLYRSKVEIPGQNIGDFIERLFADRFERHGIVLQQDVKFRRHKVFGYPSTFFPVFVNLIDNAIFWLNNSDSSINQKKLILLDADKNGFVVSDNGPGIPYREMEQVFLPGHTNKPGGQGLGLYISRQILREQGFDLVLDEPTSEKGATFHIIPIEDKDQESQ